jgi:hypothetical protein
MSHVDERLVLVRRRNFEKLGVLLRTPRVTGGQVKHVACSKGLLAGIPGGVRS